MWHLLLQFTNNCLRIVVWSGALSVPLQFIPPCKVCSEEVTVLFLIWLQGSTIVKKVSAAITKAWCLMFV